MSVTDKPARKTPRGTKFELAVLCIAAGFVVSMTGILIAAYRAAQSDIGPSIKDMVSSFATILSVSIGAFTLTNAGITAMSLRKGAPATTKKSVTVEEQTSDPQPAPSP